MLTDDQVRGWMIFTRFQDSIEEGGVQLPDIVVERAIELGWLEREKDAWDGTGQVSLTERGTAETDLHAEDWGVELDFAECDGEESN